MVGSKEKPPECGLARENRRLGQRESHRSVVWWEKAMVGSKGKPSECGLVGKSDGWVKGKGIEVWSDKKNRRLGQRESHRSVAWQGKTAAWVKETPPLKARQ